MHSFCFSVRFFHTRGAGEGKERRIEGGKRERREKGREGGSKGGRRKDRKEKSTPMSGFAGAKGKATHVWTVGGHTRSESPRAESWPLSRNDGRHGR